MTDIDHDDELARQNLADMPPVADWHPPAVNVLNMIANAIGETWRRADAEPRDPGSMAAYLCGRIALLKSRADQLWQPIDSATPGAGVILVTDGDTVAIAEWKDGQWRREGYGSYEEGAGRTYDMKPLTMWMPIPLLPTAKSRSEV